MIIKSKSNKIRTFLYQEDWRAQVRDKSPNTYLKDPVLSPRSLLFKIKRDCSIAVILLRHLFRNVIRDIDSKSFKTTRLCVVSWTLLFSDKEDTRSGRDSSRKKVTIYHKMDIKRMKEQSTILRLYFIMFMITRSINLLKSINEN